MQTRLNCLCPGCHRTTAKPYLEWICGKHWSAVPRSTRRRLFRCRRRAKRDPRWRRAEATLWERCKRIAIEEALLGVQL